MNIYTYDNTTIVLYSTEDEGLIGSSETDVDYGSISDVPTNLQAQSNLSNDDYDKLVVQYRSPIYYKNFIKARQDETYKGLRKEFLNEKI